MNTNNLFYSTISCCGEEIHLNKEQTEAYVLYDMFNKASRQNYLLFNEGVLTLEVYNKIMEMWAQYKQKVFDLGVFDNVDDLKYKTFDFEISDEPFELMED